MIARLLDAFQAERIDLTAGEVADMLWLMQAIASPANPSATAHTLVSPGIGNPTTSEQVDDRPAPMPARPIRLTKASVPAPEFPASAPANGAEAEGVRRGLPFRIRSAAALQGSLGLMRALRPLRRRVPSRLRFVLNEIATAERIAEQDIWVPVLRPAPARWLDLALVIDEAASMALWQPMIVELRLLLEHLGAFRDVRVWGFDGDADVLRLHAGVGASRRDRPRSPGELIEPSGRRLVLVVSDAIGRAWYNGEVMRALEIWGAAGPLTLVQVLAEELWERSALYAATEVRLRAPAPGVPNTRLQVEALRRRRRPLPAGLPVPVVTLEQRSLATWAQVAAGMVGAWAPGYIIASRSMLMPPTTESLSADELVRGFQNTASPVARRLAGLLAAAPVTLPVLWLIQQTLLPESRQIDASEVFLSGMLRPIQATLASGNPRDVEYEFAAGVRERLLDGVPVSESTQVLKLIADYMPGLAGDGLDIRAILSAPGTQAGVTIPPERQAFATIAGEVLGRLGGEYAQIARQLRSDDTALSAMGKAGPAGRAGGTGRPTTPAGSDRLANIASTTVVISPEQRRRRFPPHPLYETIITPDAGPAALAAQQQFAALPLESVPAVAPLPATSRMSVDRNPLFAGRAAELQALAKSLKAGDVTAIAGLGGVGKSQLASEFAHRYGQFFAGGVFWLNFADPDGVSAEVAACGGPLNLRADFDSLKQDEQLRLVLEAWRSDLPRLLVFDGCEDEELLGRWLPPGGGCRVLLTGRRTAWDPLLRVAVLALEVLLHQESIAMLRSYRPDLSPDDRDLGAIAAELGDLPLALALAGSYLARYRDAVTPAAYLTQLRQSNMLHSISGGDMLDSAIGRTFTVSYRQLDPINPVDALALRLLEHVAAFAPGEPISLDLLQDAITISDERVDDVQVKRALARLQGLGLLETLPEGSLRMHRLLVAFVQRVATDPEARSAVKHTLLVAARRLNKAGRAAPLLALQPHLRHTIEVPAGREDQEIASLCSEMGLLLQTIGDYAGARGFFERALVLRERTLGDEHPDTAISLNNLAALLQAQGDLDGARQYYERALAINRARLGERNPYTASTLNNLAGLLQVQGDLGAARAYFEQALAINRASLGDQHSEVAAGLNNLATLLQAQGDLGGARAYFEQALAIRERVLDPDNTDTAISLANLATLLQVQGDAAAARPLFERALAIVSQSLGDDHPTTRLIATNLAALDVSVIREELRAGRIVAQGDAVGGDRVMGDKFVEPTGPVQQRFINTSGGDYAEGNIDKRGGINISQSVNTVSGSVFGVRIGTLSGDKSDIPLILQFERRGNQTIVRWEADIIGERQSQFHPPYDDDTLALVVKALDAVHWPEHPSAGPQFDKAERERLAQLDLWRADRVVIDIQQRIGRALYEALRASRDGAIVLDAMQNYATAEGLPVNYQLLFPPEAVSLAALPWELLADKHGLLLSRGGKVASIERYLDFAQALSPPARLSSILRILTIAPNADISVNNRTEERAAHTVAWAKLIDEGMVEVEELNPTTLAGLADRIQDAAPIDIIYFYGHVRYRDGQGALLFDTPGGGKTWLSANHLVALLGYPRLMMITSASSDEDADLGLPTGVAHAFSAAGVQAVVSLPLAIRISAAARFSAVLFRTLAQGESVQRAVGRARRALFVEEPDGASWSIPTLTIRSRASGPLFLVQR